MPVNAESFRHALARFPSGVTIVTTAHNDQLAGLTVSAFSSVSLSPPLILVCIDKRSPSLEILSAANAFAVNFLSSDQQSTSNHFASRIADKFENIDYSLGSLGQPILDSSLGSLECSVYNQVDAGDHIVVIGQVEQTTFEQEKMPLVYFRGNYHQLRENNSQL